MIRWLAAAGLALSAAPAAAETVDQIAARYHVAGEILVGRGDRVVQDRGYGTIDPAGGAAHKAGERWRLASITKQVTAAVLLRDHAAVLDTLVVRRDDEPLPERTLAVTLRDLLTHHSGLANPDDTAASAGVVPDFYRKHGDDLGYCLSKPAVAGSAFHYNNCDYIVAAAEMNGIRAWPEGMTMARGEERALPGFVAGKPETAFRLGAFGAAGGLIGTARAVFRFDRSLMTGRLLAPSLREILWTPEGKGSYQALGQWVFPGTLKGCVAPKRIVQRDGEIYGVQARNFILPDDDIVVIVFTNRSSDDFMFGEVWEGKGFVYDLLSTVACP